MYRNNGIILTMCIQILNVISAKEDFTVELFPLKSVVHVGSGLELYCRVKGCAGDASFIWSAHGDNSHGGDVEYNQTVSRLLFRNLLPKHSEEIVCKAQCLGKSREKKAFVQVYSFPTDPVLARITHFRPNQVQRLNCIIHNIYPAEKFKIEWVRGDETLHEEEPDISDYEDFRFKNFNSTYNYTPSVTDLGKNIICMATLHLKDFPFELYRSNRTTTLEYGPGTINVSSNNSIVQLGKHLEITCHADGNPQPKILWWKIGERDPIAEGQNEKLVINKASWSQAGWYECEARNEVGSLLMPVQVIVQVPPKIPKIQLANGVDPSEGDNITILCSSDSGPTTLKLSGNNKVAEVLNGLAVFLNLSSVTTADAGVYVCEAKNDFGMNISMINITVKVPSKIPKIQLENVVDPSEGDNITNHITDKVPPKIPKIQLENVVDPSEGDNITVLITDKEQQDISTTPDLPTVIVPTVGSVTLLTALAVLIRYLRKIKGNSFNISMN